MSDKKTHTIPCPWLFLVLILVTGLCVRLSYIAVPGHWWDTAVDQNWMQSAVQLGIGPSYQKQVRGDTLPQYPPGWLAVMSVGGYAYKAFVSQQYHVMQPAHLGFAKAMPVFADLASSLLLYLLIAGWKGKRAGVLAAFVYALHPAVVYNSVIWGQTDSLHTAFVLLAALGCVRGRWALAAAAAAFACLIKPQAIIYLPLLLFIMPLRFGPVLDVFNGTAIATLLTLMPTWFSGTLDRVMGVYLSSADHMKHVSWNAYNLWWAILGSNAWNLAASDEFLGLLPYGRIGLVLFGSCYLLLLVAHRARLRRMPLTGEGGDLLTALAFVTLAFFLFSAGVHERYLFSFAAFGMPLLFTGRRGIAIYCGASIVLFFNQLMVLPGSVTGGMLSATYQGLPVLLSMLLLSVFGWFAWAVWLDRPALRAAPAFWRFPRRARHFLWGA